MTDPRWDPRQYERFEAARDRAALDLMLRLPPDLAPREIWDLGCGLGQHASILRRRHPLARVHGLDASAEMLARARQADSLVDWRQGDIAAWAPQTPPDLILANASLQWLPDHETLLPRLAETLAPGGVLAVQMPMAFETRHHSILRAVAAEGPWAPAIAGARPLEPLLPMERMYALLTPGCDDIDLWSTSYLHALSGDDPVLEWMKGTALRPYLTILEGTAWIEPFLAALSARLSEAFPQQPDGTTLLPFPRLFLIGRRRRR